MNAPFAPTVSFRFCQLYDQRDRMRLRAFLDAHPEATAFHRPEWIAAVARGTGNAALALLAERNGVIVGYLPLVDVASRLFGRALVSSGFAVGGGIVCDDPMVAERLVHAVEAEAAVRHCQAVELRGGVLPADRQGWSIVSHSHCGFVAPLHADPDAQLQAIPRKQRAEVRKGLAGDLAVTAGTGPSDRDAHYAVYSESVRNLGTPVFPRRLFGEVLDAFGDDADILTIRHQGKPVASVLSLYHRGAVMPYWGGGTRAARQLRANDRMYFELMLHARRRGCERFDFGRSKTGSGAWHYKRNWGFEPMPLAYAHWTSPGAKPRNINPDDDSYGAKVALWKRLPLPLANLVGPRIARGLG